MATRRASRSKRMSGGAKKSRKASKTPKWAQLVKKVHAELKKKNKGASLGDAMKEASRRRKRGNM